MNIIIAKGCNCQYIISSPTDWKLDYKKIDIPTFLLYYFLYSVIFGLEMVKKRTLIFTRKV